MREHDETRCGYVALIGAPNAGKSTLLNALVGQKIAIVSPKVQTTRTRVLGIATVASSQIIFVDTPGIFAPRRALDRAMVAAAWTGAEDADLIVLLDDASRRKPAPETLEIAERLVAIGRQAILCLTKIDLVRPPVLLERASLLDRTGAFSDVFMVSATTGDGLPDLSAALAGRVPTGPFLFPPDQVTDVPLRLLAAEITREQLYLQLERELPYASTVETETWEERADGSVAIHQVITVERAGQKAIVLGKGGARIRELGAAARAELETLLERRVHLFLFVRVRSDWAEDPETYRTIGLERPR